MRKTRLRACLGVSIPTVPLPLYYSSQISPSPYQAYPLAVTMVPIGGTLEVTLILGYASSLSAGKGIMELYGCKIACLQEVIGFRLLWSQGRLEYGI